MDYKLADRLRKAGFPQNIDCNHHSAQDCGCYENWEPTLSELIEACGDEFYSIRKHKGSWVAEGNPSDKYTELGKTPKEAVANLWLKLNK